MDGRSEAAGAIMQVIAPAVAPLLDGSPDFRGDLVPVRGDASTFPGEQPRSRQASWCAADFGEHDGPFARAISRGTWRLRIEGEALHFSLRDCGDANLF